MAADSEFCNGRLRLTAFLRAVEAEGPKPPTRFKRVACIAFQQQKHLIEGTTHSYGDSRKTSRNEKTLLRRAICVKGLEDQHTRHDASHPTGGAATPGGDVDPHASTTVSWNSRPADEDSDLLQVISESIPLVEIESKAFANNSTSFCPNAEIVVARENAYSNSLEAFQESQTGGLPFGKLSLARKPTYEDTVILSRDSEHHTTPIVDIDPIENGPSHKHVEASTSLYGVTIHQLADVMGIQPRLRGKRRTRGCPPEKSPLKLPLKISQGKAMHRVNSPFRTGIRFEADGFVGEELKTVTLNEAKFQRRAVSRKPGRNLGLRTLELTRGSPRAQTPQPTSCSTPVRAAKEVKTMSSIRIPRNTAKLAQLESMPKANQAREYQGRMQQNERIIYNQLSSVTAPTRLESAESARSAEHSPAENSEDESVSGSSTSKSI